MTSEEITESIKDNPIMQIDRKGKPYDKEFAEFLYNKYYGDNKENKKKIRRPRKKKD